MLPCPQAKTTVGSYHRTVCIRRNQTRKEIKSTSPATIFSDFFPLGPKYCLCFHKPADPLYTKISQEERERSPQPPLSGCHKNLIGKAAEGGWCKTALGAGLERKQGKQWSDPHHGGIKWHFMYRPDDIHGSKKFLKAYNGLLGQKIQKLATKYALEKMLWWKSINVQKNQIIAYGRKVFSWISTLQQRVSRILHTSEGAISEAVWECLHDLIPIVPPRHV